MILIPMNFVLCIYVFTAPENLNNGKLYKAGVIHLKRLLFLISLLLILTIFSINVSLANTPKPKIIISNEVIDLGKIKTSQVVEFTFTIQNSGYSDLIIKSITTDCPCTSFQFSNKIGTFQADIETIIPPGDKIELKLIFDSNKINYIGAFKKLVIISSNDPGEPLKRVRMAGEIVPAVKPD